MASSPCLEDRRWAMFLPRGLLRPLGTPPVTLGTQNLYLFARKQRLLSELFFYIIIKPKLPLQLNGRLYDHIGKSWSFIFNQTRKSPELTDFQQSIIQEKIPGGPSTSIPAFPSIPTFSSIPTAFKRKVFIHSEGRKQGPFVKC